MEGDYLAVYDLIQFTVERFDTYKQSLETAYNKMLEREVSAFRFIDGLLSPITNQYELDAIEAGLAVAGRFGAASTHLRTALDFMSDRQSPDYRNSIKESISAVESAAMVVTGKANATLGVLLKALEDCGHIVHGAQKEAFSNLYGYTSDEGGIRHGMLDEPNLDLPKAKYMLVVCAAFIAYLSAVA
jgi:hypothetical protein